MVGRAKPPTRAEKARMTFLKEHMPCLPCLLVVNLPRLPSVQHLVEGMKRVGHLHSYSSCEWHHFGYTFGGASPQRMIGELGPSLAHGKRTFQSFFGSERILVRIQDRFYASYRANPWMDYDVPDNVRVKARHEWDRLR